MRVAGSLVVHLIGTLIRLLRPGGTRSIAPITIHCSNSHRWKANLRILEIQEIKTVPNVPLSHPFVERLIGTIRREFLDHVPFWTSTDLERKPETFSDYYNQARSHRSLDGATPISLRQPRSMRGSIKWQRYCRGLHELPIVA